MALREGFTLPDTAVDEPTPLPTHWDLALFVPGTPVPKGDLTGAVVGRPPRQFCKLRTKNEPEQRDWRRQITAALDTSGQLPVSPWPEAVVVWCGFVMPRTAGLPKTFEVHHLAEPDADKLLRCTLDALTKVLYVDDARVTSAPPEKRWARVGESPGLHLRVAYLPRRRG